MKTLEEFPSFLLKKTTSNMYIHIYCMGTDEPTREEVSLSDAYALKKIG